MYLKAEVKKVQQKSVKSWWKLYVSNFHLSVKVMFINYDLTLRLYFFSEATVEISKNKTSKF